MAAKGKWAQGISPGNFTWIIQDQLAVCERPGGYGANHRKVRRQEEIIWIREQGFACGHLADPVAAQPAQLRRAAASRGGTGRFRPRDDDPRATSRDSSPSCAPCSADGGKVLVHHEELGDRVVGLMAGYLLWAGVVVEHAPQAISVVEQHRCRRQIGPGRPRARRRGRQAPGQRRRAAE